jgi:predicted dehydrogenase
VRAAVIGTGAITREHLAYLSSSPRTELVAVADLSAASARYAAERWGAKTWFTSYEELLAQCRPEVVHVLTPPTTHPQIVSDCLRAGAHVICEKPMAPTHEQLVELQALALERGLWLLEDQNYRYNEPVLQLQEIVRSGRLGMVREVEVRMSLRIREGGAFSDPHLKSAAHSLPAGPIHDFLPHLAYLGLLFVPDAVNPERVSAHWTNRGGADGLWRWDELDATIVSPTGNLRLRFSSTTSPSGFSLHVRGDVGEAATDLFQPYLSVRTPRRVGEQLTPIADHIGNGLSLARSGARNLFGRLMQQSTYHGLHRLLEQSYAALQTGGRPPLSYEDMDHSARLIDMLLREENRR